LRIGRFALFFCLLEPSKRILNRARLWIELELLAELVA
jgi:hypothetical protein